MKDAVECMVEGIRKRIQKQYLETTSEDKSHASTKENTRLEQMRSMDNKDVVFYIQNMKLHFNVRFVERYWSQEKQQGWEKGV